MGKISSICSCLPKNLIFSAAIQSLQMLSAKGLSGPSPNKSNLLGITLLINKKVFITSSTRFTFLKLLACTIIRSPFGAINCLKATTGFL